MEHSLSRLRRWALDHKEEDIRGWPLRDEAGRRQGTVAELVFDSDTKHVTHVVLDDGRRYNAHDVMLGDHFVVLTKESQQAGRIDETKQRSSAEAETISRSADASPPRAAAAGAGAAAAAGVERTEREEPLRTKTAANGDLIVPVLDEEIEIEKRAFDAGGVRVETHVIQEPVAKDVRLMEEHVTIERKAVDRPLDPSEVDTEFRDGTLEMKTRAEVPVVSKRAHVTEEVVLKKERKERVEHVRDTIRHTDVDIAEIPGSKHVEGTRI